MLLSDNTQYFSEIKSTWRVESTLLSQFVVSINPVVMTDVSKMPDALDPLWVKILNHTGRCCPLLAKTSNPEGVVFDCHPLTLETCQNHISNLNSTLEIK